MALHTQLPSSTPSFVLVSDPCRLVLCDRFDPFNDGYVLRVRAELTAPGLTATTDDVTISADPVDLVLNRRLSQHRH